MMGWYKMCGAKFVYLRNFIKYRFPERFVVTFKGGWIIL